MLFDLRGRGRRRTVQVIYLSLAILMGGGLVLFGIGSDQSGGLVDAFTDDAQSGGSAAESVDKRIDAQLTKVRANPKNADAWAQLAILRFQRAGIDGVAQDGSYTEDGKRRLGLATDAWERHLALDPKQPNLRAANLMVQAYQGTEELDKAVRAKQLVTAAEDPPSSNLYQQLAALAWQAGENRVGDLAASRAVDLAEPDQRKELRDALQAYKTQVASQAAQNAPTTTAPQ
ncbi:MAG: hypothetical protein Q8K79_20300 [Solirubrobacteraceae bacterium]|nr:hypothetical protein [Solirubrobacteraceae bacterium]